MVVVVVAAAATKAGQLELNAASLEVLACTQKTSTRPSPRPRPQELEST
eukprot:COSAG02_NODE_36181_length_458_cov_0.660167_1_plen_48_part_01